MESAERRSTRHDPVGRLRPSRERALPDWWPAPVVVVAAAVLWEGLSRAGWISKLYFPPPSVVFATWTKLVTRADLLGQTGLTFSRLLRGLVLGGVPALVFGWIMGWSRRTRAIADPLVAAAHPIPKIALLPLLMVIFGIGELSKTIAISIGVFFPLLINSMTGVKQISPIHFEVARNLGVSAPRMLFRVVIPGSLPIVLAGFRVALNVGLLVTITTEIVAANRGLGARLWLGWETFRPEEIYAVLLMLAAGGLAMNAFVQWLTRRLVPWRSEPEF
jgi:ABC-type nitrate/sulfonate/bicarbonate transport system permease component